MVVVGVCLAVFINWPISPAETTRMQIRAINDAIKLNYPAKTNFRKRQPWFQFFKGKSIRDFPKLVHVWESIDTNDASEMLRKWDNDNDYYPGLHYWALKHSLNHSDYEYFFAQSQRGLLMGDDSIYDFVVFVVSDETIIDVVSEPATDY